MLELFQEWYENRHAYARAWKKRTGGRIMGFFCTYGPEEILLAAHILPVRILGAPELQQGATPAVPGPDCSFCRDCLTQGLQGRYDYLDGIVVSRACPLAGQALSEWPAPVPVPYSYCLPGPHGGQNPDAYSYWTAQLAAFQKSIEEWTGTKISAADLDRGIAILSESRLLLRRAFETRKKDNPPLTGLEALYLILSSQVIDKGEHSRVLREVLEKELPGRDPGLGGRIRLMLLGSADPGAEFVKRIEAREATFVIDDLCAGTRYFWNEVIPAEDRLAAIAARYLDRPPCTARGWPLARRREHLLKLARDWRVQGAVIVRQACCDPCERDLPALRQALDGIGVPSLFLEPGLADPPDRFKIRVEAFLESLRPEDLF